MRGGEKVGVMKRIQLEEAEAERKKRRTKHQCVRCGEFEARMEDSICLLCEDEIDAARQEKS